MNLVESSYEERPGDADAEGVLIASFEETVGHVAYDGIETEVADVYGVVVVDLYDVDGLGLVGYEGFEVVEVELGIVLDKIATQSAEGEDGHVFVYETDKS